MAVSASFIGALRRHAYPDSQKMWVVWSPCRK